MKKKSIFVSVVVMGTAAWLQAVDLTFFTCSDTHYREFAASNATQTALITLMNSIPGKKYPDSIGGGVVAAPRGVLIPGDLIDGGQGPAKMVNQQWALWKADFGLKGEGKLRFPVYEGYGNHDLNGNFLIENFIKERTLQRSNVVAIAENGFHYAWEWDTVHFVEVNLYPGNRRPKGVGGQPPREALNFLRDELKQNVGDSRRPVVIVHHYMPTDNWWTEEEKNAYFDVIKDYNVILIVHGHQGSASVTDWKGLTVLDNHYFVRTGAFVVHVTDKEMTIAQFSPAGEWKLTFKKDIEFPMTNTKAAR